MADQHKCGACGAEFQTQEELQKHNEQHHS
jgi:DNA-directed RNA polymerase subunit RPC12/RpoP